MNFLRRTSWFCVFCFSYVAVRDGTGKGKSFVEGNLPWIPILALFSMTTAWALKSPSNILECHPRLFYWLCGTIFSNITCRLIVAQVGHVCVMMPCLCGLSSPPNFLTRLVHPPVIFQSFLHLYCVQMSSTRSPVFNTLLVPLMVSTLAIMLPYGDLAEYRYMYCVLKILRRRILCRLSWCC